MIYIIYWSIHYVKHQKCKYYSKENHPKLLKGLVLMGYLYFCYK